MTEPDRAGPRPVVFFHVMKCGGTSVRAALRSTSGGGDCAVFELDGGATMRAVGGITEQEQNWQFRTWLLHYLLDAVRPSVVLGHFRYDRSHARFADDAHFVTVLRQPVDRLVSLYNYRRFNRPPGNPADRPLDEILSDPDWQRAGHVYVDTFCGDPRMDPRSDEAIEVAVDNLRSFATVGTMEDLESFSERITRRIGRKVEVPFRNPSPAPDRHDHAALLDLVGRSEVCAPDQRVYDALRDR